MSDVNQNEKPQIYRTYDDGYVVREMSEQDAKIVQEWYCAMASISKYDLDIALQVFSKGGGFYIGEYKGEVVSSAIRIPWSESVFYGSYYYVEVKHRGKGYGTRLRDEVAREYVGNNTLAIDAVLGKVAENNEKKFGYKPAFDTGRFGGKAKESYGVKYSGKIIKSNEINLDKLIEYDNKCFISADYPIRKAFLAQWTTIPDGATYVALSESGHIEGYGCRRPCIQENNYLIGPLYAENGNIAEALLQQLCKDVKGSHYAIDIWYPNTVAVNIVKKFGLDKVFDNKRMHINKDPKEYKDKVFCLTSIDVCGF